MSGLLRCRLRNTARALGGSHLDRALAILDPLLKVDQRPLVVESVCYHPCLSSFLESSGHLAWERPEHEVGHPCELRYPLLEDRHPFGHSVECLDGVPDDARLVGGLGTVPLDGGDSVRSRLLL